MLNGCFMLCVQRVFEMDPHLYVGLGGLGTDVQTLEQRLRFRKNMYELRESRKIAPRTLAQVLSNLLYEHRYDAS